METPSDRRSSSRRSWARILGTGAAALLAAGVVATSADAATPANAPIGATGSVAALSSSSMEVQSPISGQTTVSWTATTQFSKSVTESVSSITVGDCVTATGSASKKSKTTIAARNISVTAPNSSGDCGATAGGPGVFGARVGSGGPPAGGFQFRTGGSGGGGTRPSFPKGARSGNFPRQLANLDIASGKVTAVSGTTLTISGISISPGNLGPRTKANNGSNDKSSGKTKTPTKPKTETLKVIASSSTPVNTTQTVASSALAVGDCVSAFGPAASNGSVTATIVRITSTGGGDCTTGPGGGGFFAGGGGGAGGGGAFFGAGGPGGGGA